MTRLEAKAHLKNTLATNLSSPFFKYFSHYLRNQKVANLIHSKLTSKH